MFRIEVPARAARWVLSSGGGPGFQPSQRRWNRAAHAVRPAPSAPRGVQLVGRRPPDQLAAKALPPERVGAGHGDAALPPFQRRATLCLRPRTSHVTLRRPDACDSAPCSRALAASSCKARASACAADDDHRPAQHQNLLCAFDGRFPGQGLRRGRGSRSLRLSRNGRGVRAAAASAGGFPRDGSPRVPRAANPRAPSGRARFSGDRSPKSGAPAIRALRAG